MNLVLIFLTILPCFAQVPEALWAGASPGKSESAIEETLSLKEITVTKYSWDKPGGLAAGTLAAPHLMAQLNRYKIQHPFLSEIAKVGPRFIVAETAGATAVYAFNNGRLWATAIALKPAALPVTRDPFDPSHLIGLRRTLDQINRGCGVPKPIEKDRYGNARAWKASCRRGSVFARYTPTDSFLFRLLWVDQ